MRISRRSALGRLTAIALATPVIGSFIGSETAHAALFTPPIPPSPPPRGIQISPNAWIPEGATDVELRWRHSGIAYSRWIVPFPGKIVIGEGLNSTTIGRGPRNWVEDDRPLPLDVTPLTVGRLPGRVLADLEDMGAQMATVRADKLIDRPSYEVRVSYSGRYVYKWIIGQKDWPFGGGAWHAICSPGRGWWLAPL